MIFRLSAAEFANSLQTQSGRVYKWSSGSVLQSLQMVFELIVAEFANGLQAQSGRVCEVWLAVAFPMWLASAFSL